MEQPAQENSGQAQHSPFRSLLRRGSSSRIETPSAAPARDQKKRKKKNKCGPSAGGQEGLAQAAPKPPSSPRTDERAELHGAMRRPSFKNLDNDLNEEGSRSNRRAQSVKGSSAVVQNLYSWLHHNGHAGIISTPAHQARDEDGVLGDGVGRVVLDRLRHRLVVLFRSAFVADLHGRRDARGRRRRCGRHVGLSGPHEGLAFYQAWGPKPGFLKQGPRKFFVRTVGPLGSGELSA